MKFRQLRHRVDLQTLNRIPDGMGGADVAWTTVGLAWAQIVPLNGSEFFAAQQTQATVTHKIFMRYRPDISPEMRVLYDGRVYEILSVLNLGELNKELQLMCREVI